MNEPATGPLQQPAPVPRRPAAASTSTPSKPTGAAVSQHVAEHVIASSRVLAEKSSQLGQRIVAEDQQFDQQIKAKFDRSIGTLAANRAEAEAAASAIPPATSPAAQIAAML